MKDGAYVVNLDEYKSIGCYGMALYSTGIEYIPEISKRFIGNNNIITNIFGIQAYDSMMCGYFCIEFIDSVFKGKILTDCTDLFSPHDFVKNDKVVLH